MKKRVDLTPRSVIPAFARMTGRVVLVLLVLLFTNSTSHADNPRKAIKKGLELYQDEQYDLALAEFLAAMQEAPDRDEAKFDAGAALYKLQKFPEAMGAFGKILEKQNPELAANAWYNLGNTLFSTGKMKEAVGAYKNSLKLRNDDMDAKYNLETVLRMMQMQQQQQQQQGGEQDSSGQQDKQEQQQQQEKDQQEQSAQQDSTKQEEQQQEQQNQDDQSAPEDTTQQARPDSLSEMSEEEALQLLQAMEGDELEPVKEKLKRQFGKPKRVEKDW